MPITPTAYATALEYRNAIDKTDDGDDLEITADLEAISRYIDSLTGRFFGRDDVDVERTYCPRVDTPVVADGSVFVDDIAEAPTAITLNGETVDLANVELLPYNANLDPESRPFNRLRIKNRSFVGGETLKLTARWGWPAVPAGIKAATIQLTALWRLETPRATRRIPEMGEAFEASSNAQAIIERVIDGYRLRLGHQGVTCG